MTTMRATGRCRACRPRRSSCRTTQREVYVTESHSALQNIDSLLVQLMGVLQLVRLLGVFSGITVRRLPARAGSDPCGRRPGNPLDVTVATGGPAPWAIVSVEDVDTGVAIDQTIELNDDGEGFATFVRLRPGVYRVTVSDEDGMTLPVTDLVAVGDDATAEAAVDSTPEP